jgi:hypothetical protein
VIEVFEIVRTAKRANVTEDDLVSLSEASRLSNKSVSALGALLDRGTLPWYELHDRRGVEGERIQRYTSRAAVAALPHEKTRGVAVAAKRKPAKAK